MIIIVCLKGEFFIGMFQLDWNVRLNLMINLVSDIAFCNAILKQKLTMGISDVQMRILNCFN